MTKSMMDYQEETRKILERIWDIDMSQKPVDIIIQSSPIENRICFEITDFNFALQFQTLQDNDIKKIIIDDSCYQRGISKWYVVIQTI